MIYLPYPYVLPWDEVSRSFYVTKVTSEMFLLKILELRIKFLWIKFNFMTYNFFTSLHFFLHHCFHIHLHFLHPGLHHHIHFHRRHLRQNWELNQIKVLLLQVDTVSIQVNRQMFPARISWISQIQTFAR